MPTPGRRWRAWAAGPARRGRRRCGGGPPREARDAADEQERRLRQGQEPYLGQVRRLMGLKAVGVRSAWTLVSELFAWRAIQDGKELGSLVGLTPTPYHSGKTERGQGVSKAG